MSCMPRTMLPSLRVQRYGNDSEGSTPSEFDYGRASGSSLLKQRQDILRVESLGHPPTHPRNTPPKIPPLVSGILGIRVWEGRLVVTWRNSVSRLQIAKHLRCPACRAIQTSFSVRVAFFLMVQPSKIILRI